MLPSPETPFTLSQLVGTTLAGRYRLDAMLGEGGMGVVFRGHHLLLDRPIAVKVIHPDLGPNDAFSRRFEQEARSIARLEHPNIVQVTEFGTSDDGMQYMVMQLLEGHELSQLLGEPLPPARAVGLIRQVLRALDHAHARDIIHRDLKPANVFVTRDHEGNELLKLVDFGLAKNQTNIHGARLTAAGVTVGSPSYMSPEQALGGDCDTRTDIYAAGVILYEMLTGAPPFVAKDVMQVLSMHITTAPPSLPADVPRPLAAIVDRLLAKERDQRFATAKEALDALAACEREWTRVPTLVAAPVPELPVASSPEDAANHPVTPPAHPVPPPAQRPATGSARPSLLLAGMLAAALGGWVFLSDERGAERIDALGDRVVELANTLWPRASKPDPSEPQSGTLVERLAAAQQGPEACARFANVLEEIASAPHPSYAAVLRSIEPPPGCPQLSEQLAEVRTSVAKSAPAQVSVAPRDVSR